MVENKVNIFPEPTARSAVPGVSRGRGLLISLLGEFKDGSKWTMGMKFLALGGPH